jgi:hypothetical protein
LEVILNLCGFANANLLRFSDAERLSLQTQTVAVYLPKLWKRNQCLTKCKAELLLASFPGAYFIETTSKGRKGFDKGEIIL